MWERHIEARFKTRSPSDPRRQGRTTLVTDGLRSPRRMLHLPMRRRLAARGRAHWPKSAPPASTRPPSFGRWTRRHRDGFPVSDAGLYVASIGDLPGDFAIAICRAYNKWIAEFCAAAPERLLPAGMLAGLHDPRLATDEARRLAGEGFRAVFVRPNPIAGRNLDDEAYEPLWAACAAGGMAVAVHEGFGSHLPSAGSRPIPRILACHTAAHPSSRCWPCCRSRRRRAGEASPAARPFWRRDAGGSLLAWRMDEIWAQARGVRATYLGQRLLRRKLGVLRSRRATCTRDALSRR